MPMKTNGGVYGRNFEYELVPETTSHRSGQYRRVGRSDTRILSVAVVSSPCLEGEGSPTLGEPLCQMEQHLSQTRVCVD
jgi:hypothetical protein